MDDYTAKAKVMVKVLDFVQFGGPKWAVGGTIFEMWLGGLYEPTQTPCSSIVA